MFLDFSTVISYSVVVAVVILLGCKSLLPLKYQFSVVLVYLVLLSSFFPSMRIIRYSRLFFFFLVLCIVFFRRYFSSGT